MLPNNPQSAPSMPESKFNTPILFLIFNRPDTTKRVFEAIRAQKPTTLYIAADGPRLSKIGEKELCDEAKKIVEHIDWPCEVTRRYSEVNKGCKANVSEAITWFFDHVPEGIILEDDCLPDPSFFTFCEELLEKYRNDDRIKMISGDNFQFGNKRGDASYYFSRFPHIWGWATWKRVWDEYDVSMATYPEFKKNNQISTVFDDKKIQAYWMKLFERLYHNEVDTWDGQFVYAIYKNDGITILPNVNLISNIGFGNNATHTKEADMFSNIPSHSIGSIIHPNKIEINKEADAFYGTFLKKTLLQRIVRRLKMYAL